MQEVTLRDVLASLDSVLSWSYLDRPEDMAIRGIGTTPEKIKKMFLYVCKRPIDARVPVIYC